MNKKQLAKRLLVVASELLDHAEKTADSIEQIADEFDTIISNVEGFYDHKMEIVEELQEDSDYDAKDDWMMLVSMVAGMYNENQRRYDDEEEVDERQFGNIAKTLHFMLLDEIKAGEYS